MKLRLFIGVALAVAMTASLWLWFHHQPPPAEKLLSKPAEPGIASTPRLIPANVPKMTVITGKPAVVQSQTSSLAASDWSAVQKIVDSQADYAGRLNAIRSLSAHLTDTDWAALQPFLLKPDELDKTQPGQVIKNQLLDALCALNPPPAGLGDVLAKMYRDQQQNEVIRDYAVQHLAAYYEQLTVQPNSDKEEQSVQNVLWEAVNETGGSIGGTALLALKRLSQEYAGIDQGKIATTALQMASDGNAGELTHITAYQVCAQLGTTDALPVVLSAAQNGETISVKMSAIGALGLLGGSEQVPFLNSVLSGTEDRLKPAAQHSLAEIQRQEQQKAGRQKI
jgi:hypothetical protein